MSQAKNEFSAREVAEWVAPRMEGWEDVDHCTKVIQWYMNNRMCGVAGSCGKIMGVALIRFLGKPEDSSDPYRHEPDGQWNWVDLVVADISEAVASLLDLLFLTYGRRPYVAFRRGLRKTDKIKKYSVRMFDKMDSYCLRGLCLT